MRNRYQTKEAYLADFEFSISNYKQIVEEVFDVLAPLFPKLMLTSLKAVAKDDKRRAEIESEWNDNLAGPFAERLIRGYKSRILELHKKMMEPQRLMVNFIAGKAFPNEG